MHFTNVSIPFSDSAIRRHNRFDGWQRITASMWVHVPTKAPEKWPLCVRLTQSIVCNFLWKCIFQVKYLMDFFDLAGWMPFSTIISVHDRHDYCQTTITIWLQCIRHPVQYEQLIMKSVNPGSCCLVCRGSKWTRMRVKVEAVEEGEGERER